ncbi:uncharacterized protein LOC111878716 [Lactuca sativa]|uniref:uncharacterized protein LOC111878716 n=1 Tax=Lactuca sativa TaxID=4236 RepID=UPI000CD83AB3|nr:uncharacterized protein LOC111878716 [Lactuca sativa]
MELAQSLIDHGNCQNSVLTALEQPKENNNNSKKKGWNKREGKSPLDPSKKQQVVAIHATTVPTTIPAIVPAVAPNNLTPTKPYVGSLPKCNKCNFHHTGNCQEMQCRNCNRKGHSARFCKTPPQPLNQVPAAGVGRACYQCGDVGHFNRDCPKAGNVDGVG